VNLGEVLAHVFHQVCDLAHLLQHVLLQVIHARVGLLIGALHFEHLLSEDGTDGHKQLLVGAVRLLLDDRQDLLFPVTELLVENVVRLGLCLADLGHQLIDPTLHPIVR
jgi:hypothetical protein